MSEVRDARPIPGPPKPIGYALWHLEEAREWTLGYVDGLRDDVLDHLPKGHAHSVGTLLYHIAVFEVDWLYTDLLGREYDMTARIPGCPAEIAEVLPHPMLLEDGSYTPVVGEPLGKHAARLKRIREDLIAHFRSMSVEDFRRARATEDGLVTAEWVLMHLARHESEHRGQIWSVRTASERELD